MKFEIRAKQFVMRVYDEAHPDNYIASALIDKYGDRGWMSSIIGSHFHEVLRDNLAEILDQVGVRTLEGYVTEAHARLLRMIYRRGHGTLQIVSEGRNAGRQMVWVILSKEKLPGTADGAERETR